MEYMEMTKHPYDSTLTLDEYKERCEIQFFDCSFWVAKPYDLNATIYWQKYDDFELHINCESIKSDADIVKLIEQAQQTNPNIRYFLNWFWVDPYENKDKKVNYLLNIESHEHPRMYIYDMVEQKAVIEPINEYILRILGLLEHTPIQWFEYYNNLWLSKCMPQKNIDELKTLFLNMPHNQIRTHTNEYVQQSLFDDDITLTLQGAKSVADTMGNIADKTNKNETIIVAKENLLFDEIMQAISRYMATNGIKETYKEMLEFRLFCINNDIEHEQNADMQKYLLYRKNELIDEINACDIYGTTQHWINEQVQRYLDVLEPQQPIVENAIMEQSTNDTQTNIEISTITNKRIYTNTYLMGLLPTNFDIIYNKGIKSTNGIVDLNKKIYGNNGTMQFALESFENGKKFNYDFMALYDAICSYYDVNGTKAFTTKQLFEHYTNQDKTKRPNESMMQWINESLEQMAKTWFEMNKPINENAEYIKRGYLLPIKPIDNPIKIGGTLFNTKEYKEQHPNIKIWQLIDKPILYEISQDTNQLVYNLDKTYLLPQKNSLLPMPNVMSPTTMTIHNKVATLVRGIETGYIIKREINTRDFLTNQCHIDLRLKSQKQIQAMEKIIIDLLMIAIENGHIKAFKKETSKKDKRQKVIIIER